MSVCLNVKLKTFRALWVIALALLSSNCSFFTPPPIICKCCDRTYVSVDAAIKCFLLTVPSQSTADERLLLIAFVAKDLKLNQDLGWSILKDRQLIDAAKRKYALVIVDSEPFKKANSQCPAELIDIINMQNGKPSFVIVNQALYPFAHWTAGANKAYVMSKLVNGNGP